MFGLTIERKMKETRILLVEDDTKLGNTIKEELTGKGYETDLAYDGRVAKSLFGSNEYHLVLLDINIPHANGWELCKHFRSINNEIPIIMITAFGEIDDKMEAFNAGADDYLVKPFHLNELNARIKVFLKRNYTNAEQDDILKANQLVVNVTEKTAFVNQTEIRLTAKEFSLLELLMRNKGRVVSKAMIAEKIWNINFETGTNTIEVYINFLRNKIDKPFNTNLIQTKPGFGYLIKE